WAIRSRRAFSAHGQQWSSRVDPQGTGTTSTRPVVVSIRRMARGRVQTPCCSARAWATSAVSGSAVRWARVIRAASIGAAGVGWGGGGGGGCGEAALLCGGAGGGGVGQDR